MNTEDKEELLNWLSADGTLITENVFSEEELKYIITLIERDLDKNGSPHN